VPLVSSSNHIPGVQQLELQAWRARRDDYTIKGLTPRVLIPPRDSAAANQSDRVRRTAQFDKSYGGAAFISRSTI